MSTKATSISDVLADKVPLSRPLLGFNLPNAESDIRGMQRMDQNMDKHSATKTKKTSEGSGLKPFLTTGLGRLAPETREMIFINLRAEPPPSGGQSRISLTTFVDLKASCLAVQQTCRQVYLESFPIFYACKSYYLATARDFKTMLSFGGLSGVGPRLFRFDTIISLSLKGLIISDLSEMTNLRKICFCIGFYQELQHLDFLFNIKGLQRGAIEFVDDYHWAIRSQSSSTHDWKLHYAPFASYFLHQGRNFETLKPGDVKLQRDILENGSRASRSLKGNERWVEVDIGERNYEEIQQVPEPDSGESSEDPQEMRHGELSILSSDDGSSQMSEHLHDLVVGEVNKRQTDDEIHQESDDLRGQPDDGAGHVAGKDDDLDQESRNSQDLADGDDHTAQAEPDTDREPGGFWLWKGWLNEDSIGVSKPKLHQKTDQNTYSQPNP